MQNPKKIDFFDRLTITQKVVAIVIIFLLGVILFLVFPTSSVDWIFTFYPVSRIPLDPYKIKYFVNPPWTAILLYPFHFFSQSTSQAINTSLNLVVLGSLVKYKKGNLLSIFLTLTSFPVLSLLANGSIEWIPALGFLLPNAWGIPLILTKPQSGFLAIIPWLVPLKKKIYILFPLVPLIAVSFIIWGNWLKSLISNVKYMSDANIGMFTDSIAPFPWAIPVGLGLIYYILKYRSRNGELLGVLATLCLTPYFVPHSLSILFALFSAKYPRGAIIAWILLWLFPIITQWSKFINLFS